MAFRKGALLFVWFLCILICPEALGENPREFLIQDWSTESGLPGTTVTSISQTPDGYLWVGTFAGAARFDGVRFTLARFQEHASQLEQSVTSLFTDQEGTLWIGTEGGSLVRFNASGVSVFKPPSHQTSDRYLQRIAADNSGGIWTMNYEGGVCRFDGHVFRTLDDRPEIVALISTGPGGIWMVSRGELLAATEKGSRCVWDGTNEPGFHAEAIAPAREGGCWVAETQWLRRFDRGRFVEKRARVEQMPGGITSFLEDKSGNLWLGNYGGGITIVGKDGQISRLTREQGLPGDLIRCLFEDRDGNIWAGLEARGLVRIRRSLFASIGSREKMTDETILSMCETADGSIWVGSNGDGIYRLKNGQVQHYGAQEGLTNQFVWALREDSQRNLWAGTWGGGLFRLDGKRFESVSINFGVGQVVLALHEDRRGALWLGQRAGPERVIEAIFASHNESHAVPGGLPRLDVRTIAETRDGRLWFGTLDEGLLCWRNGKFTRASLEQWIASTSFSALHVDDEGSLWAAAQGAGLILLQNDHFIALDAVRSLLDDNLTQITDDGLGYLWFGLRGGVIRMKKQDLKHLAEGSNGPIEWRRFTRSDGLPANDCSRGGFRSSDGRIWFGTLMGIAVVDPREVKASEPPPPVIIEEVRLARPTGSAGAGTETHGNGDGRESSFPNHGLPMVIPSHLKIAPRTLPLEITYTALNFAAPKRVRFHHQLLGLEASEVLDTTERLARYPYLPPGHYEFRVTARNEGGEWNPASASLELEVLPLYWQTGWFRLAAVSLFALIVGGIVASIARSRHTRRILQLENLHALERERARIARDIHDDLGGSLTEISFLGALATRESTSPAESRELASRVISRANELARTLDEIVWVVNPKNDSLDRLAPYLCQFTREFLEATSIACRFDVQHGLPPAPLSAEARHNVFLVLKEALNNTVRHAHSTEVLLSMTQQSSTFEMDIRDNGCGFVGSRNESEGNGLKNMRQRAEAIGATLSVASDAGKGTLVSLRLPIQHVEENGSAPPK